MSNKLIRLTVFLLVVTGVSGLAIGYVNGITAPVIERQEAEKLRQGYSEVYPGADDYVAQGYDGDDPQIGDLILAQKGGETAGVLYVVTPRGYGGELRLLAGFDVAQNTVTGIKILSHAETPGLGANCAQPWFSQRFAGKSAANILSVVKSETAAEHEVQAITAATVTSNAVIAGVNAARAHFAAEFSGN